MKTNRILAGWLALLALATTLNAQPSILGANWTMATNAAPWNGQQGPGIVAFNGEIWKFGGLGISSFGSDVWSSSNGVAWTCVTNAAPWQPRTEMGALTYNGQMWVLGGYVTGGYPDSCNDVWSSPDGVNWTCVTHAAPWIPRHAFGAVVFNGQLWIMGGVSANQDDWTYNYNDVWSSPDGVNWTCVTNAAPWSARFGFQVAVFNNQIWVMGGNMWGTPLTNTEDVWSSPDGVNWICVTNAAPWAPRMIFGSAVLNNRLWVFGGNGSSGELNDVWSSPDGVNWICVTNAAAWIPRWEFGSVALNNQLWVLGGQGSSGGLLNDVWYSPSAISPLLSIASIGNQTALFWPAWATNCVLESTTNLSNPNWLAVTNGEPIIGVTVTNTSPAQFFRLQQN